MAYSMDPDENKINPATPSPLMSLHEQLIYKIAALDASMQSGFRRLDEKMDRFQNDLHDSQIETNDRINRMQNDMTAQFLVKRNRIDAVEKTAVALEKTVNQRFNSIETWQKVFIAKVSAAMAVIGIIWAVLAPTIRNILGIPG